MTDDKLLSQFASTHSQEAFRALVNRHLPLVYGAARRQLQDSHLAEDVAQAVFLILAKKAPKLSPSTILPAWLLVTTRYACRDARKLAHRRMHHEQRAAAMTSAASDPAADYAAITPHLDAALAALPAADREALVLRYFQDQSIKAVGRELQLSEPAAEKRLSRALQKLRATFARKNITLSIAALSLALSWHSTSAAAIPPALAATITAAAAKTTLATPIALALVKSTLQSLFWTPLKVSVAVTLVAIGLLAAGTSAMVLTRTGAVTGTVPNAKTMPIAATQAEQRGETGFTPITEHAVMTDGKPQITFIDLDHDKAFPPPFLISNPPAFDDFTPAFRDWLNQNNISLIISCQDGNLIVIPIDSLADILAEIKSPRFDAIKALDVNAAMGPRPLPAPVQSWASSTSVGSLPGTLYFKSRGSLVGILQCVGPKPDQIYATLPPSVHVRYKRVLPSLGG